MSKDLITINNLSKVYDNGFNALKSIDLKIKQNMNIPFGTTLQVPGKKIMA